MCPLFEDLDEIYGEKIKSNPPHVHETSNGTPSNLFEPFENVDQWLEHNHAETNDIADHSQVQQIPSQSVQQTTSQPILQSVQRPTLGKRKNQADSGVAALAETVKIRFQIQREEFDLSKEKWEYEKMRMDQEFDLKLKHYDDQKQLQERKLELDKT